MSLAELRKRLEEVRQEGRTLPPTVWVVLAWEWFVLLLIFEREIPPRFREGALPEFVDLTNKSNIWERFRVVRLKSWYPFLRSVSILRGPRPDPCCLARVVTGTVLRAAAEEQQQRREEILRKKSEKEDQERSGGSSAFYSGVRNCKFWLSKV